MARDEMLTIFCYDISKDSNRRKTASILEKTATRVQYSVFETRCTKQRADALSQRIAALLEDGDSLRVYVVGSNGQKRCRVFGDGPPLETKEGYWIV